MIALYAGVGAALLFCAGVLAGYAEGRQAERRRQRYSGGQLRRDYEEERQRRRGLEQLFNVLGYRTLYKGMNHETGHARYWIAEQPHKQVVTRGGSQFSVN